MKMSCAGALVVSAAVFGLVGLTSAKAAPLGQGPAALADRGNGAAVPVDLRPYRHCHWANGRRWCHGPHYDYYDDYGYEEFPLPFFGPFFWSDPPYFRSHRDYSRRYYGRRDYSRRSGREGRRDRRR